MKRIWLTIIFLLSLITGYGHSDGYSYSFSKNIVVAGGVGGDGNYVKTRLLKKLIYELNKFYFNDTESIHIRLNYDFEYYDIRHSNPNMEYCVGIDSCFFQEFTTDDSMTNRRQLKEAVSLYCRTDDLNVTACLKLIYYALTHKDEIRKAQSQLVSKTIYGMADYDSVLGTHKLVDGFEIINTIDSQKIRKIVEAEFPELNRLLSQRLYRSKAGVLPSSFGGINYYVQSDKFYVYKTGTTGFKYYDDEKFANDTNGKVIAKFPRIHDIASDGYNNYLIFQTNDTFYHLQLREEKVNGPFHFPTLNMDYDDVNFREAICLRDSNTLIIPCEVSYGHYTVAFNMADNTVEFDTLDDNIKLDLKRERRIKEKIERRMREKLDAKQEYKYRVRLVMLMAVATITINFFLAFTKRL